MELSFKKICTVCGDKALGYNFNALTCESCKAFFRRNALRNKNFRCSSSAAGNNNHYCLLTPDTRKYCRYCRLKKCFEIGMRKDWILTKQNKKLNNHRKYRHHQQRYDDNIHPDSSAEQQQQKQSSKTNIILVPISVESM
uniref:Vitamin D3 receptor B-like n=1 Tax=Dermatophagoides pteronyssinus TaxID=6956 RepID=A0A6P6XR86_DERPT